VDAPVAQLGLVALPYDRDSLLAALAARNPKPVATERALDSLYQAFQGPFSAYAAIAYRVQGLERRLAALKTQLDSLPRGAPAYDSLYRAFQAAADSLPRLKSRRDEAQRRLAQARATLGPAMDSLRQIMTAWQDSTYRGYDTLTQRLSQGLGREQVADSTDQEGRARLRLPPGDWWIYAQSWDAWDPNRKWYWNVKVTGERVVLDRTNGRRVPRY
jgi:hypothetical protein